MEQFVQKSKHLLASEMSENTPPDSPDSNDQYDKHLDELLEEALEDSFPASDPFSISPAKLRSSSVDVPNEASENGAQTPDGNKLK
jgi:hypothetical protein